MTKLIESFLEKLNVSDANNVWIDACNAWRVMAFTKKIRPWSFARRYAF